MSTSEQQNRNALDLLRMVAPERGAELENLVQKYTPSFLEATDQPRFVMQASLFGFVQYSNRTLLQVWLFGWVMWREMYCWSTFLWLLANKNQPFLLSDFEAIPGQTESYIDADSVHSKAMAFARSDPMDWTRWPSSVPKPLDIALGTKEDWLIKDLIHHAIAFFLLHEFRHLILHSDGYTFTSRVEEEFECDHWAAEYLLCCLRRVCKVEWRGSHQSQV